MKYLQPILNAHLTWWKWHYPNAYQYIIENNIYNIYVVSESNYNLDDFKFGSNKHKQDYLFIIDYHISRQIYGLLFFDKSSANNLKNYYFCIVDSSKVHLFDEDLKNQILNYTILQ